MRPDLVRAPIPGIPSLPITDSIRHRPAQTELNEEKVSGEKYREKHGAVNISKLRLRPKDDGQFKYINGPSNLYR